MSRRPAMSAPVSLSTASSTSPPPPRRPVHYMSKSQRMRPSVPARIYEWKFETRSWDTGAFCRFRIGSARKDARERRTHLVLQLGDADAWLEKRDPLSAIKLIAWCKPARTIIVSIRPPHILLIQVAQSESQWETYIEKWLSEQQCAEKLECAWPFRVAPRDFLESVTARDFMSAIQSACDLDALLVELASDMRQARGRVNHWPALCMNKLNYIDAPWTDDQLCGLYCALETAEQVLRSTVQLLEGRIVAMLPLLVPTVETQALPLNNTFIQGDMLQPLRATAELIDVCKWMIMQYEGQRFLLDNVCPYRVSRGLDEMIQDMLGRPNPAAWAVRDVLRRLHAREEEYERKHGETLTEAEQRTLICRYRGACGLDGMRSKYGDTANEMQVHYEKGLQKNMRDPKHKKHWLRGSWMHPMGYPENKDISMNGATVVGLGMEVGRVGMNAHMKLPRAIRLQLGRNVVLSTWVTSVHGASLVNPTGPRAEDYIPAGQKLGGYEKHGHPDTIDDWFCTSSECAYYGVHLRSYRRGCPKCGRRRPHPTMLAPMQLYARERVLRMCKQRIRCEGKREHVVEREEWHNHAATVVVNVCEAGKLLDTRVHEWAGWWNMTPVALCRWRIGQIETALDRLGGEHEALFTEAIKRLRESASSVEFQRSDPSFSTPQ